MSVHLKWGEIHPRTMLADLGAARQGRRDLPQGAGVARVLRRRAVRAAARPRASTSAASSRGCPTTSRATSSTAWQRGPHRLPDRRRGHAPAARDRLDAQPGADDRRRASWSRTCTSSGSTARGTSCTGSSTATWPPTSTAGSGRPGCGTDAAPYFRVFNPTTQGAKFDPDGAYVRRWVPELRRRSTASTSHEPTAAPDGAPAATPSRSWTTRRSAPRRSTATSRIHRHDRRSLQPPARFNGPARSAQRRLRRRLARRAATPTAAPGRRSR